MNVEKMYIFSKSCLNLDFTIILKTKFIWHENFFPSPDFTL